MHVTDGHAAKAAKTIGSFADFHWIAWCRNVVTDHNIGEPLGAALADGLLKSFGNLQKVDANGEHALHKEYRGETPPAYLIPQIQLIIVDADLGYRIELASQKTGSPTAKN